MATIRKFDAREPERVAHQGEVAATVSLVEISGERFIQLDSYGSLERQHVGKRSQSMRLSKAAFDQSIALGAKHFKESN